MWGLRRALANAGYPDVKLILCGTAEFPGSLVYANFRTGRPAVNPSLLTALYQAKAVPERDILISGVQGNHYNSIGLLADGSPFDVHVPGWPAEPDCDLPLVPYGAVSAMLAEELREFESFCQRLKALAYRSFWHLASPPPIPDNAFIRSQLPELPSGEAPEVSPASVRLKLWTMQTEMTENILAKNGGGLLPPPDEARDSAGFLKQEYWKDSVHANEAYHLLQLEQIQSILDRTVIDEAAHG